MTIKMFIPLTFLLLACKFFYKKVRNCIYINHALLLVEVESHLEECCQLAIWMLVCEPLIRWFLAGSCVGCWAAGFFTTLFFGQGGEEFKTVVLFTLGH